MTKQEIELALFPLVFLWDSRREAIGTDQWVEKHIRSVDASPSFIHYNK